MDVYYVYVVGLMVEIFVVFEDIVVFWVFSCLLSVNWIILDMISVN